MGKSTADLLTPSGYVRGCLSGAATIVTQLVTHLRLAAEVTTCLQSDVSSRRHGADLASGLSVSDRGVPLPTVVNGTLRACR